MKEGGNGELKGEEMKEKCIGISMISHISGNGANAVLCACSAINSSPVVIIRSWGKVAIQPRR